MIASLKGSVIFKSVSSVILEVNGIGFEIFIPGTLRDKLPSVGEEAQFFIYTHIYSEGVHLYGFSSLEDRTFFQLLLSVPGIGPKVGLGLLSESSPEELSGMIQSGNVKFLSGIRGVGKKTAERLILELKEKVPKLLLSTPAEKNLQDERILEDAVSGLVNFGFNPNVAEKTVRKILSQGEKRNTVDIIRAAFKELSTPPRS